jgi:outer membrane protein
MLKSSTDRWLLCALTLLAALGLSSGAQAQATTQLKVGVVNVRQLLEEAPQYKAAMTALENEFKPRQKEIETQQKEYKAREDKLQRDGAVMAEAERAKAERDLRDRQRELVRRQNEFLEDLNVRRNEELGKLNKTLLQEVQTYAKAQGYDLIVGDGVLFAKDSLNVTSAVIASLRGKAPAAAPAAGTTPPKPAEKKP